MTKTLLESWQYVYIYAGNYGNEKQEEEIVE